MGRFCSHKLSIDGQNNMLGYNKNIPSYIQQEKLHYLYIPVIHYLVFHKPLFSKPVSKVNVLSEQYRRTKKQNVLDNMNKYI